jgi:hypothetical protein
VPVGPLLVAGGHVVGGRVAEHMIERLLGLDILGRTADHDGEFALVLDLLRVGGQPDHIVGTDHRCRGLEEQQRPVGHGVAQLCGMVRVVASRRHHLARQDRRQQPDIGKRPPPAGERDRAERMAVDGGNLVTLNDAPAQAHGRRDEAGDAHWTSCSSRERSSSDELRSVRRDDPAMLAYRGPGYRAYFLA